MIAAADITTVAVVGTGSIGGSWTALALAHGLTVHATDPAPGPSSGCGLPSPTISTSSSSTRPRSTGCTSTPTRPRRSGADLVIECRAGAARRQARALRRPGRGGRARRRARQQLVRARAELRSRTPAATPSASWWRTRSTRRTWCRWSRSSAAGRPPRTAVDATMDADDRRLGRRPVRVRARAARSRRQPAPGGAVARGLRPGPPRRDLGRRPRPRGRRPGPGLRWALLGPIATQHLSGGPGGLAHVLEHLGPPMVDWWADLGAPELTPELIGQLWSTGVRDGARRPRARRAGSPRSRRWRELLALKDRLGPHRRPDGRRLDEGPGTRARGRGGGRG